MSLQKLVTRKANFCYIGYRSDPPIAGSISKLFLTVLFKCLETTMNSDLGEHLEWILIAIKASFAQHHSNTFNCHHPTHVNFLLCLSNTFKAAMTSNTVQLPPSNNIQLPPSNTFNCHHPTHSTATIQHIQLPPSNTFNCHHPTHSTATIQHIQLPPSNTFNCHHPTHSTATIQHIQLPP